MIADFGSGIKGKAGAVLRLAHKYGGAQYE